MSDNDEEVRTCLCSCGTKITSRYARYAPGHDSRHVSKVAWAIIKDQDWSHLEELPSEDLRRRARSVVEHHLNLLDREELEKLKKGE